MLLEGKVALVSGGGRGIGRGIAVELARAGADVGIADLDPSREALSAVQATGRRGLALPGDVSDRPAVERMLAECTKTLGPLDIVVAAAVTSVRRTLLDTDEQDLRRAVEVAIFGTFHLFQVAARQMVDRGTKGALLYVSSPHARLPFKGAVDYNTAKAGAHQLVLSAANELMWHGIRVNVIEPGWTDTPGERAWYSDEVLAREARKMPLGRLATPEDMGKAAVFLVSEQAAYVCGAVLRVDGGTMIQGPAWYAPARHGEGG